jgi:putative transposase
MGRLARFVVPGLPHHVTQRGNGRAQTFFGDGDYALYRDLLATSCHANHVEIWSWVLMPNHVHLILRPVDADGIRRALAPVHRRYAGAIHARLGRTGHFWQGRFGAVAMDETHLAAAARYVALNPVRAGLVATAAAWPWSSARAHLSGQDDGVTTLPPFFERFADFASFIATGAEADALARLRRAECIGRPLGDARFIAAIEAETGRAAMPKKRGPKPKAKATMEQLELSAVSL